MTKLGTNGFSPFSKCGIFGLQVVIKGIKVFGGKKRKKERKALKRYIINSLKRDCERDRPWGLLRGFKVFFLNFKSFFFKIRKIQLFMTTFVSKLLT